MLFRSGYEAMLKCIDEMLDSTERRVRSGIRSVLKEGTYSAVDWLDEDGVTGERVKLAVTVTIKDGHLTLDLSDCSPQLGSGKNVPLTHCFATAYFCLKSVVDPFVPTNEGLYRAVTIIAPEKLVVNPVPPAAVSSRNMTSMILAEAINNALGQALLAKRMGKRRIVAETGAGQHGVASATACALLGLDCHVYMGTDDMARQALNVLRMRLLGAEVIGVDAGSRTLKDAIIEAMRD